MRIRSSCTRIATAIFLFRRSSTPLGTGYETPDGHILMWPGSPGPEPQDSEPQFTLLDILSGEELTFPYEMDPRPDRVSRRTACPHLVRSTVGCAATHDQTAGAMLIKNQALPYRNRQSECRPTIATHPLAC